MSNAREAKHDQIKQYLLQRLKSGDYKIGGKFYTEPELENKFYVSRGTIRKALGDLQQAGFLIRLPGKGTTVARIPNKPVFKAGNVPSFTKQIQDAELAPRTKVLERDVINADASEGRTVEGFGEGMKLIRVRRLRLGGEVPMALQTVYLSHSECFGLLDEDLSQSLMALYKTKYNRRILEADEELRIMAAEPDEADLLHLPVDSLVVVRDRISRDEKGNVFEVLHSIDRIGFAYRYHIGEM